MLKLTYSESDLSIEHSTSSLESFVTQRVVLALRLGLRLCVEPSRAAFLIPMDLPDLPALKLAFQVEPTDAIALCPVDKDYLEVSLQGVWLANYDQAHAGIFVCAIAPAMELLTYRLWQTAQAKVTFLS